ncbi:hypothetical protein M0R45_037354 [Rubus argutus]|uniref:Uncharacterized protein n=1 Tax=Rubus argutus TaxID=59490 RepID=A0AAW1W219_RUBAR
MNNVKGSIWGTATAKLVCAFLSLPVPYKPSIPVIPDNIEQRTLQKILLVGCNGSGQVLYLNRPRFYMKLFLSQWMNVKVLSCNTKKCVWVSWVNNKTPYSIGPKLKFVL